MNDKTEPKKLDDAIEVNRVVVSRYSFNEAPASLNFFAITEKGWNLQITLRDEDEFKLLTRFAKLVQHLESVHVTPSERASRVSPKQVGQPAAQAVAPTNGNGEPELAFAAEKLVATVNEGKTFWKIKGGRYGKFGITIWPEVLEEAGFKVESLDPTKVIDLKGYLATYLMEDGKATKIVKLTKGN